MGFTIAVFLLMAIAMAVAVARANTSQQAWTRVAERIGLQLTNTPTGLTESMLADLDVCPTGNGTHGLWHGADTRDEVTWEAETVPVDVGVLLWWWETQTADPNDSINQTVTHDHAVALLRLPFRVPHVTIVPEGRLARLGVGGRDDLQVESEEFNRRFDVDPHDTDPQIVVRLLDAAFQRLLLDEFTGRHIELVDDLLVVAGEADDRKPDDEPDLRGRVTQLPHARRDVIRLAGALPATFRRAVG